MSSGKKYKPWSDRVHESIVSRNASGQLNLVIKGGAEEGKFPFFGPVKQEKVIYHSGKIQDGEILLEVNDQSIVGLTLYDLNNLIIRAPDPVRFKSVKEGQALVKDLKIYLNHRFEKGSVDYQLQAAIRDNLYLRSLPCTTRKLRNGETDGVDYTFLTVEQFRDLEASGVLLESGIFEGNYYGTPKPPPKPLSPQDASQSNTSGDLPASLPSPNDKRKRNKASVESPQAAANSENRLSGSEATVTNPEHDSTLPSGEASNDDTSKKEPSIEESVAHSEKIFGPLPEGWEMAQTDNGDFYYIDHLGKKTSWLDPRLDNPNRKKLEDCEDDELPYGWEKVEGDPQFGTYFVDHVEKITQFENPVLEAKKKLQRSSSPDPTHSEIKASNDVPDSTTSPNNEKFYFTNDPSKLKGKCHLVPIEKRENGFGFTIVGGDDPEEFLQIKSVVSDGAAAFTENIEQGDIIVRVNERCVLGWTHPDVVKLFQAIPVGQIVTLELCRGYPLLVDSDDPDTKLLDTYAIHPDDKPNEEFERQLRVLNSQIERNSHDEFYPGLEGINLSSPSKSMPDITVDQNYDARGYYGNTDLPPAATFLPQNMYARSGSMGALPAPVVLQIIVEKGAEGFGFTIADSPKGQRVKQILDGTRCQDLVEGDVLLEINGMAVQNMPHNNVVQLLKDCPFNSAAIFVIQRGPMLMGGGQGFGVPAGTRSNVGPGPSMHDPYAYQAPNHTYVNMMKRSHTEPGLGSENGSVVSAPPGSTMAPPNSNFPLTTMMNDYRAKHAVNTDRGKPYGTPVSSGYPMYAAPQQLYQDPYLAPQDHWVHHTVILRREESGFGFRILGGNAQGEAVTIGAIVSNGAAAKEGTLRTGDELLTVDGQRVTRMGHNQVVSLMGHAARNAVVQLGIRRRVDGNQMSSRPFRGPAQRQLIDPGSRPSSRGPNIAIANRQPFDLVIHRRPHEGFGFVIISSVKSGLGLHAPHKIGRIIENSPADRCRQLRVGDRILAVNEVDITHLHHGEIVNLIKDSALSINIRVLPLDDDEEDDAQDENGLKVVELQRWRRGFGFGIRGGREYNMPLYVLRVADDGPAAESGLVKVGDILIEINGRSTLDIPHGEAINLIRQGGPTVRLVLKQGDGSVPELEANAAESVHSISSSAVSGMDPSGKRNPIHDPEPKRSSPAPNASIKTPLSPTRAAQNSKYARRRANSSGQILPLDDPPNSPPRLRRAITPNPTLAYREAGYPSSESDGPESLAFRGGFPRSKSYDNPHNGGHPGASSDNARMNPKDDFNKGNFSHPISFPQPHINGGDHRGDFGLSTTQAPMNEDAKKSKSSKKSKFGKSKLSKVGLWVSPKKK